MTLTTRGQHEADCRARDAYDASGVNPYAIAERVIEDGGDVIDAGEEAHTAMLADTGDEAAADRARMNARGYAEELVDE